MTRLTKNAGETSRTVRISAIGPRFRIDEDDDGHADETLHPKPVCLHGKLATWLAALREFLRYTVDTAGMTVPIHSPKW